MCICTMQFQPIFKGTSCGKGNGSMGLETYMWIHNTYSVQLPNQYPQRRHNEPKTYSKHCPYDPKETQKRKMTIFLLNMNNEQ